MYDKNLRINKASHLYHLQPIEIGTPYVENLTSYIKRLAKAHCVSVGNLLGKELIPEINKNYIRTSHFIGFNSKTINAFSSDVTKAIVKILEEKTCNKCLTYLTMNSLEKFFNPLYMLRKKQAWCPICYEESLQLGQPIYEQLIWNFKDIEICKKHHVRLMHECPHCGKQLSNLTSLSQVGYCDYCKTWLGLKKYENSQITSTSEKWQNWVYDNIAQLLLTASKSREMDNLFSNNITKIVNSVNISQRKLENQINLYHGCLHNWQLKMRPQLTDVLSFSFVFKYSITELLNKDINDIHNVINDDIHNVRIAKKNKPNMNELKKTIDEAIANNKILSLRKLSTDFKTNSSTIKKYFPEEITKLKVKNKKCLRSCKLNKLNLIKHTMKSLFQDGIFPSRKALTRKFGKRMIINDDERKIWYETLEELGCITSDDYYKYYSSRK